MTTPADDTVVEAWATRLAENPGMPNWYGIEALIARIRADAATIADLRRQVEERDATIARLRDVAVKALPMNGKCSHGIAGRTCSDAVEELRLALSALAPGDLGGEG